MKYRITSYFLCLILSGIFLSFTANAQQSQGGVDAVGISSKYYNGIVKILLYDSAIAKKNPEKAYLGRGSGFFVSEDGYIFTNRHVINMTYNGFCRYQTYNEEEKKTEDNIDVYNPSMLKDVTISKITAVGRAAIIVQVYTNAKGDSSKLYHAQIVALDTLDFDGAILKINSDLNGNPVNDKFHVIPIGNSDSIKQGQDLCLFGFPAQYSGSFDVMLKDLSTLIFGKHSGYDFRYNSTFGFIKTDAAINNGNSGGPVFGPSNTVIGIATAAFEKTNVGLIGGIDAMYYVAALIPDLQKVTSANGLVPPGHAPAYTTVALYKPLPLPSIKDLKHSNSMPGKKGIAANKAYGILNVNYGISGTNKFSIDNYSGPAYNTKGGSTGNAKAMEWGVGIRIVKPSMFKQRNNLVGYFFDINPTVYSVNWQSINLIYSPVSTIKINPADLSNAEPNLYGSFGLCYTYLFQVNVSIGVYYGPAIDVAPLSQINLGTATATVQKDIQYSRNPASFVQNTGLIFRFKAGFLGLDYRFGNSYKMQYILPDAVGNTSQTTTVNGSGNRNMLSVFLGVNI